MKSLDTLDRKILIELDKNSRATVSQLAKKLRQGRDRIDYRINRLEAQGTLQRYTAAVNLYKLGFCIYKLYLRLENNRERIADFVKFLQKHPRVYWIALCDGRWDMMIAVFARSPREYYNTQVEILSAYNSIVLDFGMYTIVDMWVFRKDYLTKKRSDFMTLGGDLEEHSIDQLDYQILRSLSQDSRRPLSDLANELETTAPVVRYRIERLEKNGIIIGYPIELSMPELDMLFFKSQLFLRNYKKSARQAFINYCIDNPHITFCIRQIGDCTLEIETEVSDYAQYNAIIEEIRVEFAKLIRNFESILIRKTYFNWVPGDLEI